ncbi:alcohol-forming fatty acyl-CoA reductase-like [Gossypium australe]|uniref:Alcohol-forming fatty acyl-CoA reductase-like n=1 Tax=Gossypium australe TaxID=47621 RepID=A0A5B6VPM1_9ROSI|nr:alcohol-forming fatty acyl-CoA reductase-like [Gossypium australe]
MLQDDKRTEMLLTSPRSTHSYIDNSVSENLGISVKSTMSEGCTLSGARNYLSGGFDGAFVWEHSVSLDCATKRVVLRTEEDEELVVIRKCQDYLSHVISELVVEKLAYLAYVSTTTPRNSSIGDIRIMRDFSNVFPKELLGLPTNREVEFGIELLSGIARCLSLPIEWHQKSSRNLKLNCRSCWTVASSVRVCLCGEYQYYLLSRRMGP